MTHWAIWVVFAAAAWGTFACSGPNKNYGTSTPPSATTEADLPPLVSTPLEDEVGLRTVVPSTVDVCATRRSLNGRPLIPGLTTVASPTVRFQLCVGAPEDLNTEKFLFRTADEGRAWVLISRTDAQSGVREPGVGTMPDAGMITSFVFNGSRGWLGLDGPAKDLLLSKDGGVTWQPVPELAAAVPVQSIEFTDALNGTVTTVDSRWSTVDNGAHWTMAGR